MYSKYKIKPHWRTFLTAIYLKVESLGVVRPFYIYIYI